MRVLAEHGMKRLNVGRGTLYDSRYHVLRPPPIASLAATMRRTPTWRARYTAHRRSLPGVPRTAALRAAEYHFGPPDRRAADGLPSTSQRY